MTGVQTCALPIYQCSVIEWGVGGWRGGLKLGLHGAVVAGGGWAAVVPLTIAATPFFARIAEVSLREVDHGLIEAAQAMGCRRWHIVWHVLLPEALPGIVGGFTITLVTMINSSAMAGAIGAGGLGDIAYRYGYQRFDTQVMLTVIVLLVVLVAVIQLGGDRLAVRLNKR